MRTSIMTPALILILLAGTPGYAEDPAPCDAGTSRHTSDDNGWSVCIPSGWSQRERGSEVVWSPEPGLDLVFGFRDKVVESKDVSAPLVSFLKKKKAVLHVSPAGQLKYQLDGVDGVGLVKHEGRFGLVIYPWCDNPGKACKALVRKSIEVRSTVRFDPMPGTPYDDWEVLQTGGLELYAPSGSPAAQDLAWLGEVYGKGYAALLKALGAKASEAPLRIYFYRSEKENYSYTRRRSGFNIAGDPGEVHSLFAARNDRQSTGHEMTHAITNRSWGETAEALLGEGIAVAMDLAGIDHHARAQKAINTLEPAFELSSLLGQSWWQHDMELSYGVSGSVVTFLLTEGSMAKVKALYQAKDLHNALRHHYGWTFDELEARWRKAIAL